MILALEYRIGIDGEKQFRDQLKNINQQVKTLGSEMKAVTAAFDANGDKEAYVTKQTKLLTDSIEAQKKKVEQLEKAVEESTKKTGATSTQTLKWKQALADATTQLNKTEAELRDVDKQVDNVGDEMEDASTKTSRFGDVLKANLASAAIIGGLKAIADGVKKIAEGLTGIVKDAAEFADEINTLAAQTGLATSTLQEFKYMEKLVDVDLTTVTGALAKLTKNMSGAEDGTGAAADAFAALGVAITDDKGELRNNEQVFYDLIDALGGVENETQRDAYAMAIFGKSAQELNPLIKAGGDTIAAFAEEAHRMGYVLSEEDLAALNAAQDAFDRISLAVQTAKNRIAVELAPVIEDLSQKLIDFVSSVDWAEVGQKIGEIVTTIVEGAQKLAGAIDWQKAFDKTLDFFAFIQDNGKAIAGAIAGIAAAMTTFKIAMLVASGPAGLVVTAIAGVVAAFGFAVRDIIDGIQFLRENWDEVKAWWGQAWEDIKTFTMNALADMGGNVETSWENIKQATFSFLADMGSNVDTTWQNIKQTTFTMLASMGNNVSTSWENIKQTTFTALAAMGQNVSTTWQNAEQITASTWAAIGSAIGNAWQGIQQMLANWGQFFSGLWSTVTGIFSGVGEWFRGVGQALIQGIWQGISDKVEWLKRQVQGVVEKIKGWFTGTGGFDTHSPSKWSEALAENIMLGFPRGFRDGMAAATSAAFGAVGGIQAAMRQPIATNENAFGNVMANTLTNLPDAIGGGGYKFDIKIMLDESTQLARKVFELNGQGARQVGASYQG